MKLDPEHESILHGESGAVMALAMKTLVDYGDAFGAKRLVPIKSAHLAGSFGMLPFPAYFDIISRLANEGAKVRVPTTINPRPGRELNLQNRITFSRQKQLERDSAALGVTPNYSCACYFSANVPAKGDIVGWSESSAVQYANSVLGARTNRNSILTDICSAVTGVTPEFGYLLDENRRGRVLVKLKINRMEPSALGFLIGRAVIDRVPVIEHYPFSRTELKNLGGAMAASGATAMFHVEGVTPEAPTLDAVFDGQPEETMTVTQADIDSLRDGARDDINMVVFGCPHLTCEEAIALAQHFTGKRSQVPVWFFMIPDERKKYDRTKEAAAAREAGVSVYEYCPLTALTVRKKSIKIMTNSGKLYYYLEGTRYGHTEDCLRACGVL